MGRPKRVYPKTLHLYDKFHTRLVKMMNGTQITALHLIKETEEFFWSLESWAFCCGHFKAKKKNFELQFNLPLLSDEKTEAFLNKHAWHDWMQKEHKAKDTDMLETTEFLNRLFPDKKKVFFYELKSLVSGFCHGSFVSYDRETGIEEKPSVHAMERRSQHNFKYTGMRTKFPDEIDALHKTWLAMDEKKVGEKVADAAYDKFREKADAYLLENNDLTPVFRKVGEHVIVVPYAFTKCCVEGSSYENAGEIYLIITEDTVFFEIERHF